MRFCCLLSGFAVLFAIMRNSEADRIATYKELKIVDTPSEIPTTQKPQSEHDSKDLSFYVEAEERLEKLKAEAEEIRDVYNELIKNTFGIGKFKINQTTTTTTADESMMLGAPKKSSADWVRAAISPLLLNDKRPTRANNSTP